MTDRIKLQGMTFYAFHGVGEDERRKGQVFSIDVEVRGDFARAGRSDRLEDTVDYSQLFREIQAVVEGPPHNLLESLAEEVASRLLSRDNVTEVQVEVRKPHVHMRNAVLEYAGVRIERTRSGQSSGGIDDERGRTDSRSIDRSR
ncbi:MAG TPA: dihydroneopterin aldolase [bacterium]|nr:dihydroneopterin aldolase [bacterium]